MLVGNVIGSHTDDAGHVDFTIPMLVFAGFGIAATIIALILMQVDKQKGYGLSEANVKGEMSNESDQSDKSQS